MQTKNGIAGDGETNRETDGDLFRREFRMKNLVSQPNPKTRFFQIPNEC